MITDGIQSEEVPDLYSGTRTYTHSVERQGQTPGDFTAVFFYLPPKNGYMTVPGDASMPRHIDIFTVPDTFSRI